VNNNCCRSCIFVG